MKPGKITKKPQEETITDLTKALHKIIDNVEQMDKDKQTSCNSPKQLE